INLLFGLGPLVAIPLTLLGGRLIDRFGSHDVFRLALLPAAVAFLLLLTLPSLLGNALSFATGYLLTQIAFASFDTLRSGIPTSSRGTLLGTLGTITGLLSSTGVPLAGYFKEAFGPSLPFYLAAFTAVAGTLFDFLLQKSLSRNSPAASCRK
ncbi:MAG: MFS transporter, partial [Firmicutes bacterium]|nr:MFS transporter [Bacillota bacterium]